MYLTWSEIPRYGIIRLIRFVVCMGWVGGCVLVSGLAGGVCLNVCVCLCVCMCVCMFMCECMYFCVDVYE